MPSTPAAADDDFDYEATLARCAAGDRQAMRRLYEHEGPRLLGVAWRIVRQRALAEDIVHDACVNIWTRAGSFDASRGSARGWIYSVVRNLALNAVRDAGRHLDVDDDTVQALEAEQSVQAHREIAEAFGSTPAWAACSTAWRAWTRHAATACCTPMWMAARTARSPNAWARRWAP